MIAECASSWNFSLDPIGNAYRMIEAAKECGADAAKFQWVSDVNEMAYRRNDTNPRNYDIISYHFEWLEKLKAKCDEVGIEFMCTVFLTKDIAKIEPLVKRFKIASAESTDLEFTRAHYRYEKEIIISHGFGSSPSSRNAWSKYLHCVVSYPTLIEQMNIGRIRNGFDGLSDHSTSMRTGGLAVALGASICEKHVRLEDTPNNNPDYPHSLPCDINVGASWSNFKIYVANIREAELAMGNGENVMMSCEDQNQKRRVRG